MLLETNRMDRTIHKGRNTIIAVIAACLLISLASILLTNMVQGSDRIGGQSIRFLLTILLCVLLYQGKAWVRWVLGILFLLSGLGGLISGAALLAISPLAVILIIIGIIYLACVVALFFVSDVQAFLAHQRTRRGPSTTEHSNSNRL
jgi:hypothetical protein